MIGRGRLEVSVPYSTIRLPVCVGASSAPHQGCRMHVEPWGHHIFFYHAPFVLHAMSQLPYRGRWTSGPKPKIDARKGTLHCRQDGVRTHLQSFKVKGTLLWGRFLLFADNEEGRGLGYQEAETDEVFYFQGEGSQHCAP